MTYSRQDLTAVGAVDGACVLGVGGRMIGWRIGREMRELRGALAAIAGRLAEAVPDSQRGAEMRDALRSGRTRVLRIALTGPAGVSVTALAAAIAQRPGLLPVELPAKSAPVIRLHFGRPGGPRSGAIAHLFDNGDWRAIRELRPAGLPDAVTAVDPEGLHRQVEEMRTRAFMRLGDDFHALLGQTLRIDTPTPGALARFVGIDPDQPGADSVRERARFADMTREVEIFLEPGPFDVPVTLVVTPGIDRDFPVRACRTADALADADLCVAALPGARALSQPDRALLDWLTERFADRLVVFLDRSDPSAAGGARADARALQGAVARHCLAGPGAAAVGVHLGATSEASEALVALAGRGEPLEAEARLSASGVPALAGDLAQLAFWRVAVPEAEGATDTLRRIARQQIAGMERQIALIVANLVPDPDSADGEAWFAAAVARLDEARTAAFDEIETRMSDLWAQLRADALKTVRTVTHEAAAAAVDGPVTEIFSLRLRRALDSLIRRHRSGLAEPMQAAARAMSGVAEELGAEPTRDLAPQILSFDTDKAMAGLVGLDDAEAIRRLNRGPSQRRADDLQRQALGPAIQALEVVIEATTLALKTAACEALDTLLEANVEHLAHHQTLAGKSERLDRLEASLIACIEADEILGAMARALAGEPARPMRALPAPSGGSGRAQDPSDTSRS